MISAFEQALRRGDWSKGGYALGDIEIWKKLSKAYLKGGYFEKAQSAIKKVLEKEPGNKKYKDLELISSKNNK